MLKEMNREELKAVDGGAWYDIISGLFTGGIKDAFFGGYSIGYWIGAEAWQNENR